NERYGHRSPNPFIQQRPDLTPARDHPARDLALSPLHPELPRCRGTAGRARARDLLRNGAALGAEVRSRDRATAAPAAPSAEQPMAPGRDGGADRREADVPLAGAGVRGWLGDRDRGFEPPAGSLVRTWLSGRFAK